MANSLYHSRIFDAVITDLPYGTTNLKWDSIIPLEPMWKVLSKITRKNTPIILFGQEPFSTKLRASNLKNFKYDLIWKKNVPTGMSQASYQPMRYHEYIHVFNATKGSTYNPIMKERVGEKKECYNYNHYCGKSNHINIAKQPKKYDPNFVQPSSVLEFGVVPNRSGKLHPTQKPVELLEYLIRTYTNDGNTVLDFTAGSFSTAIACINTNRKFVGIEKDKSYYSLGKERVKKHYDSLSS